jgi:hypothetical protein
MVTMHPAAVRVINLAGFALIVAGLVAAITLVLLPLPTLTAEGSAVAWCGPGQTSDNALQVRLNPGIVNTGAIPGQPEASQAKQQTLVQVCGGVADSRITEAAVIAIVALALGVGIPLIARRVLAPPRGYPPQAWGASPPGG